MGDGMFALTKDANQILIVVQAVCIKPIEILH